MTTLDFPALANPATPPGAAPLPAASRLELRAQQQQGGTVVTVWGELHHDTVGELSQTIHESIAAGRTGVVLDLCRLYDLDADAIAELDRLQNRLAKHSGGLWLAAPRPWVRRLLDHMCLKGTFAVHPTVAAALTLLNGTNAKPAADASAGAGTSADDDTGPDARADTEPDAGAASTQAHFPRPNNLLINPSA